jgi:hypothetical protein
MAQHECLFDHSLLGGHKLPPHDACRCNTTQEGGPAIYTLHWYRRLACVIQQHGQVLAFNKQAQRYFASLDEALPYMSALLLASSDTAVNC